MSRSDLAQELQWVIEAIQDDVEGVHARIEGGLGRVSWIRNGTVYAAHIERVATRIGEPGPETRDPGGAKVCIHGTDRGQFCKACDEEPE